MALAYFFSFFGYTIECVYTFMYGFALTNPSPMHSEDHKGMELGSYKLKSVVEEQTYYRIFKTRVNDLLLLDQSFFCLLVCFIYELYSYNENIGIVNQNIVTIPCLTWSISFELFVFLISHHINDFNGECCFFLQ